MPSKGRCVVAGSSKRPTGGGSEEGAGLVLGSHLFIIGINIWFFIHIFLTAQLEWVNLDGEALIGESYRSR